MLRRAIAVVVMLLHLGGCAPEFGPDLKHRVVDQIGVTLEHDAYADGVDFSNWSALIEDRRERLDAASSPDEFVYVVNDALDSYGVSHLRLLSPDDSALRATTSRADCGVTAVAVEEGLLLSHVIEGGPADEAGLQSGDIVTRVDGMTPSDPSDLSGDLGRQLEIEWNRGDAKRFGALTIRRGPRASPSTMRWLTDDVAYISVSSFLNGQYQPRRIKQWFDEIHDAKGLVLDLRSNKGGNADHVAHLLAQVSSSTQSPFLDIYREDADSFVRENPGAIARVTEVAAFVAPNGRSAIVDPDESVFAAPLVVLIDRHCGSGGELAPAALKALGRATVIGRPTRGLVMISDRKELIGGYSLQYPIGELLSLNRDRIEARGVTPDITISDREIARDEFVLPFAVRTLTQMR